MIAYEGRETPWSGQMLAARINYGRDEQKL